MNTKMIGTVLMVLHVLLMNYVSVFFRYGSQVFGRDFLPYDTWTRLQLYWLLFLIVFSYPFITFTVKAYSEGLKDLPHDVGKTARVMCVMSLGIPYFIYVVLKMIYNSIKYGSADIRDEFKKVSFITLGLNWVFYILLRGMIKASIKLASEESRNTLMSGLDVFSIVLLTVVTFGVGPVVFLIGASMYRVTKYLMYRLNDKMAKSEVVIDIILLVVLSFVTKGFIFIVFMGAYIYCEKIINYTYNFDSLIETKKNKTAYLDVLTNR